MSIVASAVYGSTLNTISNKPGREVVTHQGGIAYEVDALKRVRRFLILGSEGGSYYVSERDLTLENAKAVATALDQHGTAVVDLIVEVSQKGLAPKQQPTLMALALAASHKDAKVRKAALNALPKVCRTASMLFEFAEYVNSLRGWGRGLRNAFANWYTERSLKDLVYQAIKYRKRNGWSHADLLRLAHPKPEDANRNAVYKWMVDGEYPNFTESGDVLDQLAAFEVVQTTDRKDVVIKYIVDYRLPREAIPTRWLKDPDVWSALLESMPMMAMVRNLGQMSNIGLLKTGSEAERIVIARLNDAERIRRSRIHPMSVLEALKVYERERGVRGSNTWIAVPSVVDALDGAFYASFKNVVPTNKRILLGVDVSGSMSMNISGFPMTCKQAAGAMALVTMATEPLAEVISFDTSVYTTTISARQRLDDVMRQLSRWGSGTNLTLPIRYARTQGGCYDGIVIYTDNENGVRQGIYDELDTYRARFNREAKVVAVAMAANQYSLARPTDQYALDIVGFDASAPSIISNFIDGSI